VAVKNPTKKRKVEEVDKWEWDKRYDNKSGKRCFNKP
jgi:hypothetical protein